MICIVNKNDYLMNAQVVQDMVRIVEGEICREKRAY